MPRIRRLNLAGLPLLLLSCSGDGDGGEIELDVVPPEATDSAATGEAAAVAMPRFTDVLDESGIVFKHHFLDSETGSRYRINPYDHGAGLAIADVNGDGLDDVYFLDFLGPNALYLNRGGLRFEDVTAKAGVAVERALSVGAAFGDCDGDGDPDLYVTTYRGGNRLFRNRGDGTFDDVTAEANVGYVGHSNGTTWLDYDLDGDLDLFLCNIGRFTTQERSKEADWFFEGVQLPFGEVANQADTRNPGEGCILYRNDGKGVFEDVTKAAGVTAAEWNGDACVADYDLDGDPDLYVSNMFGANRLLRNDGAGRFEETTETALGRTSWGGMGTCFFDANGDEWPDLLVTDMHSDMWLAPKDRQFVRERMKFDTAHGAGVLLRPNAKMPEGAKGKTVLFGNTYFENRGDGTFAEKSAEARLETWWPWGVTVGDFNEDGAEDLFLPSGMGFPFFYWPNRLLLNDGKGVFTNVTRETGLDKPALGIRIAGAAIAGIPFVRSSRAAATSDLDGDGDLDLVVANFNHEPYLYRNDSPAGRSLQLRLRNRAKGAAYGARVKVTAGGRNFFRQLANAYGYLQQSSAVMHVGLGHAAAVERVEVWWPGAKTPQVVERPQLDQVVTIDQS